jgi:hypothetical protein
MSFVRVLSHERVTSSPAEIVRFEAVSSQRGELEPPPPPPPPLVMSTDAVQVTDVEPSVAVSVYVVSADTVTSREPSTASPLPTPLSIETAVAFVVAHVRVTGPAPEREPGVAVNESHRGPEGLAVTVTTWVHVAVCPVALVTVRVYVVFAVGVTDRLPAVVVAPASVKLADAAFVDVHENVDEPPGLIVAVAGVMVQIGVIGPEVTVTVTVHGVATVPLAAVAVSVYVVVTVGETDVVPSTATEPTP